MASTTSIAFYDRQARDLAGAYEGLSFEEAHPQLLALISARRDLRVLDVGAGTGRDAAALAAAGQQVTAVEPSSGMLQLAKELHPRDRVRWLQDSLPELRLLKPGAQYDLIVLSAVWMHIPPRERVVALARLEALRAPGGTIYMTVRSGPAEPERQMYPTSLDQLVGLAAKNGLVVNDLGQRTDLLHRSDVIWQTVTLTEASNTKP